MPFLTGRTLEVEEGSRVLHSLGWIMESGWRVGALILAAWLGAGSWLSAVDAASMPP
jgi:hypothetical protein